MVIFWKKGGKCTLSDFHSVMRYAHLLNFVLCAVLFSPPCLPGGMWCTRQSVNSTSQYWLTAVMISVCRWAGTESARSSYSVHGEVNRLV